MKQFNEALEEYGQNFAKAISVILKVDEEEATAIADNMALEDELNLIVAIDSNNDKNINKILRKYENNPISMESIYTEMQYHLNEKSDSVIVKGFNRLLEDEIRELIQKIRVTEQQKLLANIRGFKSPGTYERSLLSEGLADAIVEAASQMSEDIGMAPGAANRSAAYGNAAAPAASGSNTNDSGNNSATYKNDDGEMEQGEVVSKDSRNVTVKTKKGNKRMSIDSVMIDEEDVKVKDKTKGADLDDWSDIFNHVEKENPVAKPEARQKSAMKPFKKMDKAKVSSKLSNIDTGGRAMPEISGMEFTAGEIEQDAALLPPPETDNVPAVRSGDMVDFDNAENLPADTHYMPEFINITDLPGYMQQGIRMMGRKVFGSLTTAQIEDMAVMSTLTHEDDEFRRIANIIGSNGSKVDDMNMTFTNIKDYGASAQLYTFNDTDYLLVEDMMGKYIYAWPTKTRISDET